MGSLVPADPPSTLQEEGGSGETSSGIKGGLVKPPVEFHRNFGWLADMAIIWASLPQAT